ncbi:MAG: peptidoglycan DD-metalloendopeptidase family protein [Clostridia bacterium]|nr:peptidoglycan DD-metalloendopeptidase family protein [Clostridia bacterium]
MKNTLKITGSIKKYRVQLIAVSVFVAALVVIAAFSGNRAEPDPVPVPVEEPVAVSQPSEVSETVFKEGCGLYVDGVFIAANEDESALSEAVAAAARERGLAADGDIECVYSFANAVSYESGSFAEESFAESSEVTALLCEGAFNSLGEPISASLSVTSKKTYSVENVIEHSTRSVYTDSMYEGYMAVDSEGADGVCVETYEVTLYNGVEVSRNLVSSETLVEPVDEVLRYGTKKYYGRSTVSIGVLAKPYDGYVSSGFGARWGTIHKGIDLAMRGGDCYGDPALCAADGVVTFVGWRGGYGNCVKVQHADGMETVYAHLSRIGVAEGQEVLAGDQIGNIGATGNVTGPHLHFEVYIDGIAVDPLIFLNYDDVIYD